MVCKVGIVGGLGSLAGGDLFHKLLKSQAVLEDQERFHFLFEQHPFSGLSLPLEQGASMTSRKFYVFDVCKTFERSGVDVVLLPCFASHTFRDEIQQELAIPVLDLMDALSRHLEQTVASGTTLGVMASDFVRHSGLFEKHLADRLNLVYPSADEQTSLMHAVYEADGIKHGQLEGAAVEAVYRVGLSLQSRGATLVVPGMTELSLVCSALQWRGVALLDANALYANAATRDRGPVNRPPFKLGIVGGVGPAATVDFIGKVVRHTPATRDQQHIKMVVEQNPQIPDRTAHLLHGETDPTLALFATCKRLESAGAEAIAIPCNTAHAFVARIQPHLHIPIVNMLTQTLEWIVKTHGRSATVGLLATSGTVHSQVYQAVAGDFGVQIIVPRPDYQHLVMEAIYGERGIKAGFTDGLCKTQLLLAAEHLCEVGARVLILGCTELPLVLEHDPQFNLNGHTVALVDPTTLLALSCISRVPGIQSGTACDPTRPG
nr:amino acid racemase [Pseudomonas sp. UBA1879]